VMGQRTDLPEHITKLGIWLLSKLSSAGDGGVEDMDTSEGSSEQLRKRRAEAAKARKAKILAQMSQAQKNFAAENKSMLAELQDGEEGGRRVVEGGDGALEVATVCLGPTQSKRKEVLGRHQCILCQEEESVGSARALVMAGYVQPTTVFSQEPVWDGQSDRKIPKVSDVALDASRSCAPHISSCGHFMHATCYQKYMENVVAKERDRHQLLRDNPQFDVASGQYMCPICDRLCNSVIPVLPPVTTLRRKQPGQSTPEEVGLNTFIKGLKECAATCTVKDDVDLDKVFLNTSIDATAADLGKQFGKEFLQYVQAAVRNKDFNGQLMEPELQDMMNTFSQAVLTNSLGIHPDELDPRLPAVCVQAAATALIAREKQVREEDKPLFGAVESRDEELVKQCVRFTATLPVLLRRGSGIRLKYLQSTAIYLITQLFNQNQDTIFHMDVVHLLLGLLVSLPSLIQETTPPCQPRIAGGQGLELHCLKLCLFTHIVQILRGYSERAFVEFSGARTKSGSQLIHKIVSKVTAQRAFALDITKMNYTKLCARLEVDVLPLLRCAGVFFHHLTDVPPGSDLVKDDGATYRLLASYLGLPSTLAQLLESPAAETFLDSTLLKKPEPELDSVSPTFPLPYRRCTPPPVGSRQRRLFPLGHLTEDPSWRGGLIPLPRDYTDLLHLASEYVCPKSVTGESKDVALCLVCGTLLCIRSFCCEEMVAGQKVRGCSAHAQYCGAGTGIFLELRECNIILLQKLFRGCTIKAPYLDVYGETDQGLKRGNPLTLDPARYQKINRMWLNAEVPNKIARMFDPDILMLVPWQMF